MAESFDVPLGGINGITTVQGEPSYEDDLVIDQMESYMYEADTAILITRFEEDISRFVTYSVIKGFIRDLEQDIARQIASKDEEISLLNQKVQQLGNGTLSLSEARDKRYDEVYSLRQELSTISKSLLNFEWGLPVVQYNSEGAEDVSSKHRGKEHSSRNGPAKEDDTKASAEEVFGDLSYLAHMDKDALITHFNKEMNQMKRHHDSVVEEKTEEIFRLKRELLKKEGSNPWHLRNNKEFEQMRKKIGEVILKLDGLLLENNKRTTSGIKAVSFHGQQDKINVVDSEIQQIQGASTNNEEACAFPSQTLHVASIEADHLKQIGMLESDIEDVRIATVISEEIEKIVVKEFINEIKMGLNGCEMEYNMKHDICSVIQKEAIVEAMININSSWLKCNEEKSCSEAIALQNQEIEKLKLAVDSFNEVLTEKEKFICQFELGAMKGRMDLLCHQLDLLRDKVEKQDTYLSEKNREFDVIVGRLEEALQHACHSEINLSELHDRFRTVTDSLKEVEKENQALCTIIEEKEKQNQILCTIIKEKEKIFTSSISKEELRNSMISVGESMREFEGFVTDQQTIIANKVQHSELRFSLLKEQCKHLTQESSLLKKKALWYKEISETRGSNLQKAELEVDLLGDEVEALIDLLAKIYIALDHYSPVLQHYTGVMETLNMIKKHISIAK